MLKNMRVFIAFRVLLYPNREVATSFANIIRYTIAIYYPSKQMKNKTLSMRNYPIGQNELKSNFLLTVYEPTFQKKSTEIPLQN